jgi:hypothetical protein
MRKFKFVPITSEGGNSGGTAPQELSVVCSSFRNSSFSGQIGPTLHEELKVV